MPTTTRRGGSRSSSQREGREGRYHHDPSEKAHYPDRRTLTGEPGIKPGVPQGEHHGMAAVLVACYGARFPMTKQEIIDEFGDETIEWYKGQEETIADVMEDVQQNDFINMADLVHAIGDVVTSYNDERNERFREGQGRGTGQGRIAEGRSRYSDRERPRSRERGREESFSDEDIQDIPEEEWNEFQEWRRSRGSSGRSSRDRGIENRGDTGEGGYDEETGAPLTKSGHIDRRTREGQEMERRERGFSSHQQGSRRGGRSTGSRQEDF